MEGEDSGKSKLKYKSNSPLLKYSLKLEGVMYHNTISHIPENLILSFSRGIESSTISTINFSILGSYKRFFDKLYYGSWSESKVIAKITNII